MLSSFAYKQMLQCLKSAAFRAGVQVISVNPAYSSTIGTVNYATRYGISIHQGRSHSYRPKKFASVGARCRAASAIA
jgi:hypothetical protein